MIRTTLMLSLICSCLSLGATTAFAQDGDTPGARPEQDGQRGRRGRRGGFGNTDQLKEQLGLSDEQIEKFNGMREEMRNKMRELREGGGGFDRSMFQEMREKMTAKVKEILTPEQLEKYNKLQEGRRGRMGQRGQGAEGRGRRGGRNNPAMVRENAVKALGLEGDAAAVVLPVLDSVLTAQNEAREALRTLRESMREKASGDVTSDELTTLLKSFRDTREESKAKVQKAQTELRELLTLHQEFQLVALGILE